MSLLEITINQASTKFKSVCINTLRLLTIGVGLYSIVFLFSDQIGSPEFHEKIARHPIYWSFHLIGGGISLIICTFLLIDYIRLNRLYLHRLLGRIYVITVFLSALSGFRLSFETEAGLPSNLGLATLSICWLIATFNGFRFAVAKQIESHRLWMMRSFALTISAVFFRLDLALMSTFINASFLEIYATVSWHSWVCTLIVVEWFFIRKNHN